MVRLQFTHMTEKKLNDWLKKNDPPQFIFPIVDSDGCLTYCIGYWDYGIKEQ